MQHKIACSQWCQNILCFYVWSTPIRPNRCYTVCNSLAAFVQKVKPISCKYTSIIHFSTIRVILNNINEINNFILNQFKNKFIREIFLVNCSFRQTTKKKCDLKIINPVWDPFFLMWNAIHYFNDKKYNGYKLL